MLSLLNPEPKTTLAKRLSRSRSTILKPAVSLRNSMEILSRYLEVAADIGIRVRYPCWVPLSVSGYVCLCRCLSVCLSVPLPASVRVSDPLATAEVLLYQRRECCVSLSTSPPRGLSVNSGLSPTLNERVHLAFGTLDAAVGLQGLLGELLHLRIALFQLRSQLPGCARHELKVLSEAAARHPWAPRDPA